MQKENKENHAKVALSMMNTKKPNHEQRMAVIKKAHAILKSKQAQNGY